MNSIFFRLEKDHFLLNNYFELLNISSYSNNKYYKPKEDLMNLKILSNINSLFMLSNNILFFSYYTRDKNILIEKYYLKLLRGTINLDSDSFNIAYKDTQIESNKYQYFNFSNCFETTKYINCLNLEYIVSIFYLKIVVLDKVSEVNLCKIGCILDSLNYQSNVFRKGIFLKEEISAYIFFQDSGKKPKLTL